MKVIEGDFVIAMVDKKPKFYKVLKTKDGDITVLEQGDLKEHPTPENLNELCLMANLGQRPKQGSVFGVKTLYLRGTLSHKFFGEIQVFTPMKKEGRKLLLDSLDKVEKRLKSKGLREPIEHTLFKVKPKSSSTVGMYKPSSNPEESPNVIELFVDWSAEELSIKHLSNFSSPELNLHTYVWLHELGHYYWYNKLTRKMRSAWVSEFLSYVASNIATEDDVAALLGDFNYSTASTPKQLFKELGKESTWVMKEVLAHIKKVHNLSLQDLLDLKSSSSVDNVWPVKTEFVKFDRSVTPITNYGMTNVREFFAEVFALSLSELKIPKSLDKLLHLNLKFLSKGQ